MAIESYVMPLLFFRMQNYIFFLKQTDFYNIRKKKEGHIGGVAG